MTVGEVIAALTKCASDFNDGDTILMSKSIYGIDVHYYNDGQTIEVNFVDANTKDIIIDKYGKVVERI